MQPETDRVLQELVDDAREVFGTEFCMVNLVTADAQFFKVWSGEMPPQIAAVRQSPLVLHHVPARGGGRAAFCGGGLPHHGAVQGAAPAHGFRRPVLRRNPLKTSEGHAIGSLCLVDSRPRGFDDKDSATLRAFAGAVVGRLEALGAAAHERDAGSVASESDRITRRLLSCYLGIGEAYPAWRAVTLRQKRPPSGRDGVIEADLRMRSDRSY
jgi:hypothetical protein